MVQYRYLSASSYFKEKYGKKFRRLPIDAGFSCPGRCIYCSEMGSLAYNPSMIVKSALSEDILRKKENINQRFKIPDRLNLIKKQVDDFFVKNSNLLDKSYRKVLLYLYFQAFTNTYDTVENIKTIYDFSLSLVEFDGIFIGTRPDCIDEKIANLLFKYSNKYDLWVELGLQSAHDRTLKYINRQHTAKDYEKAVILLKSLGIKVISHVIVGLHDEKIDDLIETIKFLNKLNIDGVKFHNLYILPNTKILEYYEKGMQKTQDYDQYIGQVAFAMQYLKRDIVIFRLFSDPEEGYIAPKWELNKTELLKEFNLFCEKNDIYQGKLWKEE